MPSRSPGRFNLVLHTSAESIEREVERVLETLAARGLTDC
jgi:hypothetical protein